MFRKDQHNNSLAVRRTGEIHIVISKSIRVFKYLIGLLLLVVVVVVVMVVMTTTTTTTTTTD